MDAASLGESPANHPMERRRSVGAELTSISIGIPLWCATVSVLIDRSRYFFVPTTKGRRLLALGRLLLKYLPESPSPDVEAAGKALQQEIVQVTQAYVDRHREDNTAIAAEEAELDQAADHLWNITDARLGHWEVFERPAIARLAAKQTPGGVDYEALIDKARQARSIRKQLVPNGLEFTKLAYPEQSEYMHTLWQIIEQDQLGDPLSSCIGPEFYESLREAQTHYGDMVDQRAARAKGSSINLRAHALALHRCVQNYTIALLAMIRDEDPDNVAMLRKALRPIDAVREQAERARARSRGEPEPEQLEPELEELLAEQQAINQQIGISGSEADDEGEEDLSG